MFTRCIPGDRELPEGFEALRGFLTAFVEDDVRLARDPRSLLLAIRPKLGLVEIREVVDDLDQLLVASPFPAVELSGSSNIAFRSVRQAQDWAVGMRSALQNALDEGEAPRRSEG